VFPRGWLWAVVFAVVLLNGGFGMMWGFIIKRIIAAAAPDDRDRTASLLPITQQTGFALGAALSGLIANRLGIGDAPGLAEFREVAFWMFAGFVPLAIIGNLMLWRFVSRRAASGRTTKD
jgi:predicted MFS family arabinose efflux permease